LETLKLNDSSVNNQQRLQLK